ncbi:MAG: DNA methyltransferase [Candidatus Methanoperedens sp.]
MMVQLTGEAVVTVDNKILKLNPADWSGSCLAVESTLHQLSPYIGKIKSTFARKLITTYTKPDDIVLDPFAGSGTVILESLIAGRQAIANDINPYAITLIKAKMFPPDSLDEAIKDAKYYISMTKKQSKEIDLEEVPDWIKKFYHQDTLKEIISLSQLLRENNEDFLLACLLGILHHQRPGFLSYPASHLVPYLRTKKYPPEEYPEMYSYRDVESRLIKKIQRVYRRLPLFDNTLRRTCYQKDAEELVLPDNSIDAIISSPPYMNALDYARDNRLRLWFLGERDYKKYDTKSPRNIEDFKNLMKTVMKNLYPALKMNSYCVFVLGDVNKSKKSINTALAVIDIANSLGSFDCEGFVRDEVPTFRRARKEGACTKNEWIIVLRKVGN